jgi:hypothetical protein
MTRGQTPRLKKAFLDHFRRMGNITAACRALGIERKNIYRWQEHDAAFDLAFNQAEAEATETLEEEAFRRAHDGTRRVRFDGKGQPLCDPETGEPYTEVEYSDTLLIFLLKARAPEKYRERYEPTPAADRERVVIGYEDGAADDRAADYPTS